MSWNFLFGGLPTYGSGVRFDTNYRCYSAAYLQKPDLEEGGKIILPPSALDQLARLKIDYPMLFELSNPALRDTTKTTTHCGVLEFTAAEGTCCCPWWIMQHLLIEEGGFISVKSATLQRGTYVKLQPQSSSFLDIANPKAVLEKVFRNFSALTQGDVIKIEYNKKHYYLSIIDAKPSKAISIIETDIQVDFAPPLDYKEPTVTSPQDIPKDGKQELVKRDKQEVEVESSPSPGKNFRAFTGSGYSLKGLSSTPPLVGKLSPQLSTTPPPVTLKKTSKSE